jgi:hypothetical protein
MEIRKLVVESLPLFARVRSWGMLVVEVLKEKHDW